ncbi:MAG: fasciclin domain-containing protein, partial [Anaerolineales bacterium]
SPSGSPRISRPTSRSSIPMLNGDLAGIEVREGSPFINEAQIVATDIEASNGIIHVIDAVLLPPQ